MRIVTPYPFLSLQTMGLLRSLQAIKKPETDSLSVSGYVVLI